MRTIPVEDLVVIVTAKEVRRRGTAHWRGHWSIHPHELVQQADAPALAQGDTELYLSEENAYLFAGAEGVAVARELPAGPSRH
jgi:hypothetical protein